MSREDGSVTLKNILIPVADKPDPQPAVEAVIRLIESLSLPPGTVTLLRVNPEEEESSVKVPSDSSWKWNELVLQGRACTGDPANSRKAQCRSDCDDNRRSRWIPRRTSRNDLRASLEQGKLPCRKPSRRFVAWMKTISPPFAARSRGAKFGRERVRTCTATMNTLIGFRDEAQLNASKGNLSKYASFDVASGAAHLVRVALYRS